MAGASDPAECQASSLAPRLRARVYCAVGCVGRSGIGVRQAADGCAVRGTVARRARRPARVGPQPAARCSDRCRLVVRRRRTRRSTHVVFARAQKGGRVQRSRQTTSSAFPLLGVGVLWLVGAMLVAIGGLSDLRTRASAPDAPLRTYLRAVSDEDLQAALLEIEPTARRAALPFVSEQLGNGYRILGVGVRQPSLLDRLRGIGDPDHALLTVQLDT